MSSRHRRSRALVAAALGLVTSLVGLGVVSSAGSASADTANDPLAATSYQENPKHDGSYTDPTFTGSLTRSWSIDLGGSVGYPVIADGLVFASVEGTTDDEVEAISLSTGHLLWTRRVYGPFGSANISYDDGRLFVVTDDGRMTAFDATTGERDWVSLLNPEDDGFDAPPVAVDGTVYVGGAGTETVYAVDEATGHTTWTRHVAGDGFMPAVGDGGVFSANACAQTYRFALDGSLVWHNDTSCSGGGGLAPVLHDGALYVRDRATGNVVLDEATGDQIGTFESLTAPAFHDDYMATQKGGVLRVQDTTTGSQLWQSDTTNNITAPLFVNGDVVEGRANGTVDIRDEQDGSLVWSGSAGTEIDAPYEYGGNNLVGLSMGDGALVVPAGSRLTAFVTGTPDPSVWISGGPTQEESVGTADATYTFDSDVPGAYYLCTFDGSTKPCASPVQYHSLANGQHTFSVAVYGTQLTSETRIFNVAVPPPSVVVTEAPGQYSTVDGSSVLFFFESNVPGASYNCTLDGVTQPCGGLDADYTNLPNGLHSFYVTIAGTNVSSVTQWFTTYRKVPSLQITKGPAPHHAVGRQVSFSFTSDASNPTYRCYLDGVGAPCGTSVTYRGLRGARTPSRSRSWERRRPPRHERSPSTPRGRPFGCAASTRR